MAQFEPAFNRLMQHEGGYVFDPHDAGGETFCGISRVFWPNWVGWGRIDSYKREGKEVVIDGILKSWVKEFYRENYWRKLGMVGEIHTAYAVFDTLVQFGVRGAQAIQNILGVDRDGIIGTQTITAINNADQDWLRSKIVEWRKERRAIVIAEKPEQARFAGGWEARDNAL